MRKLTIINSILLLVLVICITLIFIQTDVSFLPNKKAESVEEQIRTLKRENEALKRNIDKLIEEHRWRLHLIENSEEK